MGIVSKLKFNIRQVIKQYMQHVVLPVSYKMARGKVNEHLAILADCHHDECPEDLAYVRRELRNEGYEIKDYFFDIDKLSAMQGFKKMKAFMKLYKTAGVVVTCSYFLPVASCKKRMETKVVNVWHGCGAMKKFGYDADDDIPKGYKGNPFGNIDIFTVSGTECVRYFKSAINNDSTRVLPIGASVTDSYFDENIKSIARRKFDSYYKSDGKKVIVWAPTFRSNARFANCVGEDVIDALMNDPEINSRYYIVKSLHPNMKGKASAPQLTTRELMMCADILITDYSSVFFEYLILDKPIVFFAPDYSEYMHDRGFYLEYGDVPGPILYDEHSLKDCLMQNRYEREEYVLQRKKFFDIYMDGCDGLATKKLIDVITNDR